MLDIVLGLCDVFFREIGPGDATPGWSFAEREISLEIVWSLYKPWGVGTSNIGTCRSGMFLDIFTVCRLESTAYSHK